MRRLRQLGRLSALVLPSLSAGLIAHATDERGDGRLLHGAAPLIAPLFVIMLLALAVRAVEAALVRRRARVPESDAAKTIGAATVLDAIDLLTAPGRALAWTAALAAIGATAFGWASLAIVGVLGLAVVQLLVTWTALVAGGDEPWRALTATRTFTPAAPREDDALVEQAILSGARVPAGFRIFARGGIGGVESRYAVGGEASSAELSLTAPLGPARRGEHVAAPLELWLQDLFGVCRTRIVRVAPAKLTVLPRPARVERSAELTAQARGSDHDAQATTRLPTEGCFRLREYAPGDDARRIHWPRSLTAQTLIVRQPDEIPPDQPTLRLVLDTQLLGTETLRTPATAQLLDALVRVWLGVGRAFVDEGTRVTLVAALRDGERLAKVERALRLDGGGETLRLGARAAWQGALPLSSLLEPGTRNVIVSARPRPLDGLQATFIILPEFVWTDVERSASVAAPALLPYPAGAPENRWSHRRAERQRRARARHDGALFDQLLQWGDGPQLEGALVARPRGERVTLEAL